VTAETYCKRRLGADEQTALADKVAELSRLYPVAQNAVPYVTTPVFPGGKAVPDGFDLVQATVDHALWFALLAPKPDAGVLDAVRTTLGQSASGGPQYLNVGISPLVTLPAWDEPVGQRSPVPYVWELSTPDATDPRGVACLTTNGVIRLALPGRSAFFAPTNDVRVDVDAGTGDKPPRLDDPVKTARLIAWLRLRPTANLGSLAFTWAGLHCVEIDQHQTAQGLVVGQGNGQPDLTVKLPAGNLEESSFDLRVEEPGQGFLPWQRIDDLAVADFRSPVYELDAEAGTVTFGDGVRGRVPARGARLRVARMRVGGGAAGNVPAGTLTQPQPPVPPAAKLKATQPLPAAGGDDAETVAEAEKRIPALFRHRDRAVTADDYRQLALTTPGARVGRAEVLPGFKPQQRRAEVPGVVSVMVLPARAEVEPPHPRVDRPFIETVYHRLEDRKPLGTELYVIGCEYVAVALGVGLDNPSGSEEVNTAVKTALQQYLAPLPPFGPAGQGWPLGRSVRRRELEVVISRVTGVDGVEGPSLFVKQGDGTWQLVPNPNDNGEIPLQAWQLPELIGVVIGAGAAPTEFKPPAPTNAQDGVAIPVVPEVC